MIDTVLFDIGGTLITQTHNPRRALINARFFREVLSEQGIDVDMSDEEFARYIQEGGEAYKHRGEDSRTELKPVTIWKDYILKSLDIPEEKIKPIAELLSFCNDYIRLENHARPGIEEMLEELKAMGMKIGVITNTISMSFADHILKETQTETYFQDIVKSCETGIRKPDKRIFEIAMERIGATPETTCYVGDTISRDVLGSRNAGLAMCILIRNPAVVHRDKDFRGPDAPKPDYTIDELAEIPEIIRQHNQYNKDSQYNQHNQYNKENHKDKEQERP